jgi:hypothetical protein
MLMLYNKGGYRTILIERQECSGRSKGSKDSKKTPSYRPTKEQNVRQSAYKDGHSDEGKGTRMPKNTEAAV